MQGAAAATDHEVARSLAEAAGTLLVALRDDMTATGTSQWALKDAGDLQSHEFLVAELARLRPDDAVLSEEGRDDWTRLDASRVWIVDPLDGTREYGEGRPDWAVHVALAIDGAPVVGAVSLPAVGQVLDTGVAPLVPARPEGRPLRLAVSRTRTTMASMVVAAAFDGELVAMGSAGFKAMAVVTGEVDAYVHAGGQYEWDNCAPAAVAMAAGLHASRLDGSPLTYNQPDPYLPDFVICRPELGDEVLELVAPLLE
ncbi:MAG TPA: 3'(2'),5'-bisphosphate nucleotidase CysQ [Acidimicrobiales bacterium]